MSSTTIMPNLPIKSGKTWLKLPTSLRLVLLATFVAISVLPVALALSVALVRTGAQARQQVSEQMNSVLQLKIAALDSDLGNAQTTLRTIVGHKETTQAAVAMLTASESDSASQASVQDSLNNFVTAKGTAFTEYYVYDRHGVIVVSTDSHQIGKLVRVQPYFAASLKDEYIQPPYYELGSNSLAVILTEPFKDASGNVVGVVAGRLNMDTLAAVMTERAGLGDTGETYLISPENNYLVTPSRFEGSPLNRSYHSLGIDSALAGGSGSSEYTNYRGKSVIGAYQWLPNLQVALIAEYEQSEALAASQQATVFSLIVSIVAAALALAAGLLIAVRITHPITELTQITQQLAGGDLSVRAHITVSNEIGVLGQAFNAMAGRLEENTKALEASVKEAQVAETVAHEANRLKSEFLATMSHELRTPLNAMIGFTEIMISGMGGVLDQDAKHMSERIHANSQRLLALINDVLDLSKIEAKRVEVNEREFSPRQMAADLGSQMSSLAEKKGLAFEMDVTRNLPELVIGDRALIERVVTNLLSNAFKFTDQGSVRLSIARTPDRSWTITVRDTGIGIPPHAQEFIFDPFRQLDGSSQRAYGGTGLGLAIVRDLVRAMDGAVKVDSAVGQGSAFTVTLPLVEAVQAEREVMLA